LFGLQQNAKARIDMAKMSVDLLIITALPEELEVIRSYLPHGDRIDSQHCELTYYVGSLETEKEDSYSYGLTCLFQMGNTDAGVSTSHAIRDLNPSYVFMFGLAAGVKDQVNLSDVIVATHIFYYEQAKLHSGMVEIRPQSYRTDVFLNNKLNDFASSYTAGYKVRFGPFAVGEKVVADIQTVEELKKSEPRLLGIEMESYGVARAAAGAFHRPRFIAIRGVSDFADEHKTDDWRDQALHNAAGFLVAFLKTNVLPREKAQLTKLDISQTLIAIHHLSLGQRASVERSIETNIPEYQGFEIQELFINQTDLYANGSLTNPAEALQRQYDLIQRLNDFTNIYPHAHIAYFGLAHIPLMFHAGYQINRRVVRVFATDRQTGEWISLSKIGTGPKLHLQEATEGSSDDTGDVIIRMSISYTVRCQQIQEIVKQPLALFHLSLAKPKTDIVTSEKQLDGYARAFHQLLVDINARFPNTQRIHLFLAAPPTVAFKCGQQVSKTVDPDILVYNFSNKDQPNYGWAINVMTGEVIERRNKS
jgi:nucleoside phosphorylase